MEDQSPPTVHVFGHKYTYIAPLTEAPNDPSEIGRIFPSIVVAVSPWFADEKGKVNQAGWERRRVDACTTTTTTTTARVATTTAATPKATTIKTSTMLLPMMMMMMKVLNKGSRPLVNKENNNKQLFSKLHSMPCRGAASYRRDYWIMLAAGKFGARIGSWGRCTAWCTQTPPQPQLKWTS